MPAVRSKEHVSSYTVVLDGQPVDQTIADRVREVRVISSLASPDVCTLTVLFEKPRKAGDPHPIDRSPFAIGKRLELKLGERDALRPTALFTGSIVTLEPEFGAGGVQLCVRAYDAAHVLFRARHVRTFQNQTASDIVSKVCQEAGVQVETDASGGPLEYVQQSNETDWEFIWRLADRIGFEFVVVDGRARFREPSAGEAPVELEYPTTLFAFHPRVSAVQQVDAVEVRAFDPRTKAVLDARATDPKLLPRIGLSRDDVRKDFEGDELLVATEPVATQEQADRVAQALLDRASNGYVTAEGLTAGNPKVRAGAALDVKGVGTTYGGAYRVHTAIHLLRGGGVYETRFSNAPGYTISGALGAGGTSGAAAPAFTAHVVLAKVTNNNDDEGLGRVRVWYPALGEEHEGTWARIAVPSAGKERGLLMLPVPDEEVLVAFEHGDITRPYVLGSLFNGKDVPGDELAFKDGSYALRSDKDVITFAHRDVKTGAEGVFEVKSTGRLSMDTQDQLQLHATGRMAAATDQALELTGGTTVTVSCRGGQLTIEAPSGQLNVNGASVRVAATGMVQISGAQIMLG